MKRFVITSVAAIGLLGLLRPWSSKSPGQSNKSIRDTVGTDEFASPANESNEPTRTKLRHRPLLEKPTIEETTELLKTTIISLVDLPADQSLPERISNLNELIRREGVDPSRLRLILSSGDSAGQWRFKDELRIREVSVREVLKYLCGNTMLRCHVRENGIIELTTTVDPEPSSESQPGEFDASEGHDPFAELPAHR